MPSPRMPVSPRDAPGIVHACSPCSSWERACRPPGPRSRLSCRPVAVLSVSPSSPRTCCSGAGCRRSARSWRRPWALPSSTSSWCRSGPVFQPSREASQPTKQHRGHRRIGMVPDGEARDRVQFVAHAWRIECGRDALAPGGGAQPGQVDDIRLPGELAGALDRVPPDGLVDRVHEHRLSEAEQGLDDRPGGRAGTTAGLAGR